MFIIPSVRKVNKVNFLDNENERPRLRLSDDQVWQEIIKLAGVTCSSDFQKLERQLQGLEQREQCDARIDTAES